MPLSLDYKSFRWRARGRSKSSHPNYKSSCCRRLCSGSSRVGVRVIPRGAIAGSGGRGSRRQRTSGGRSEEERMSATLALASAELSIPVNPRTKPRIARAFSFFAPHQLDRRHCPPSLISPLSLLNLCSVNGFGHGRGAEVAVHRGGGRRGGRGGAGEFVVPLHRIDVAEYAAAHGMQGAACLRGFSFGAARLDFVFL